MKDTATIGTELARQFYRAKLGVSGHIPNKDNLPYSLLGEKLVARLARERRDSLKDRHLLFTISPGRAGSEYLAKLLNTAGNVRAFHEPRPRINGRLLEMVMQKPPRESYARRRIKLLGINHALSRMDESTIYAETSHMFIKSFHDVVLDYYENVEVIILRRPLHKVLKSFVELGFFSAANPMSARWFHDPDPATCMAEPLKPVQEMDQYERCIAYLLDIEARARAFSSSYPKTKTHSIMLETITGAQGARDLFRELGATWTGESDRLYSSVVNSKLTYKSAVGEFVSEEFCRERLNQYIQQALAAGKSIPDVTAG
jgi:hypothetical protein